MRKEGEDAIGQVYGFMVGGVIFIAALAGIFAFVEGAGKEPVGARTAEQSVDASNILSLIIGSPGSGWADPDSLGRFGLANTTGQSLDPGHLFLLNANGLDPVSNNLLEYEEARSALGLSGAAGFRMAVTALDYEEALKQHDFSHLKALYIGDFGSLSPITLAYGQGTIINANTQLNGSMGTNTGLERSVIDSIGVDFDNHVHLSTSTPSIVVRVNPFPGILTTPLLTHLGMSSYDGDVMYDNKQYIDTFLQSKLASGTYDLLVLGSGIDHSTLTAQTTKSAIDTFVRGGGTLMVFGSPGGNFNWMQPILDLSAASVSGAVTVTNAEHPILATPWDLDWGNYPTNDLGWTIGIPSNFENVVMQGGKPVIAVSNDGAIGSGNVFLSSIQPRAVAANLGSDEAAHFMFNMLLYDRDSAEDPTIVFGPDPPEGSPVSSARRTAVVVDQGIEIPVRIELHVWATQ